MQANVEPFMRAIDQPAGRVDAFPSTATGKILRYFTPDPLPDLLERCRMGDASGGRVPSTGRHPLDALALARTASRRGGSAFVDELQALRVCRTILQISGGWPQADPLSLAQQISSDNAGYRREVVFAGTASAATAEHIYAPSQRVPELMQSLVRELEEPTDGVAPTHRATVVGYFCSRVHPFRDGNGRWARLVTVASAPSPAACFAHTTAAAYQAVANSELAASVWPSTDRGGLRALLLRASAFYDEIEAALDQADIAAAITAINSEIRLRLASAKTVADVASLLWARGYARHDEMRAVAGLSNKAAHGVLTSLNSAAPHLTEISRAHISVAPLLERVSRIATDAAAG